MPDSIKGLMDTQKKQHPLSSQMGETGLSFHEPVLPGPDDCFILCLSIAPTIIFSYFFPGIEVILKCL